MATASQPSGDEHQLTSSSRDRFLAAGSVHISPIYSREISTQNEKKKL